MIRRLILLAACTFFIFQKGAGQIMVSFPEPHNVVVLSVPDKLAALQVDLLRLTVESNTLRRDLAGRRLLASDSRGWEFSSFLFPLSHKLDSKGLREEEWADLRKGASKEGLKIEQARIYDRGSLPMIEYMIEDFLGQKVHQKNVYGYMVSGNMAIDFHNSKGGHTPEDEKFFGALVNGIKLIEAYEPDSKIQYGYGSIFYLQKNWVRAAAHYEEAVELEKGRRTLSPTEWRVLVDNLGMAYRMSRDLGKAKATFEYGAHEDPTYPMFHYNLACADAALNDLDRALEELRTGFQYRNNSIPGEGIPDPAKDGSFKPYLNDTKFQKVAREVCPAGKQSLGGWICE